MRATMSLSSTSACPAPMQLRWPGGEGQIGEAVPRGHLLRGEPRGIECLRIRIQVCLAVNGVHGNGDRGALRDVKAADGVVFHRDARDGMNRRMQAQRFVDDLAGVLKLVHFFGAVARRSPSSVDHLVAHLRAELRMPRQRPVDPAQARRRSLVTGEEQRGDLVAQRLVVELIALGAARRRRCA